MHAQKQKGLSAIFEVTVERSEEGAFKVFWKTDMEGLRVFVYVGKSPDTIQRTAPAVVVKDGNSAEIRGLDPHVRYYFEVTPEGQTGIIAGERRVPLEGSVNFRDLGGYVSIHGRRVKWGQVFRSDNLARLTETDRVLISRMGLKTVCDFRALSEVEKRPDLLPEEDTIRYLNLPVEHGRFDFITAVERIKKGDDSWMTQDLMVKSYIRGIEECAPIWGSVINKLAEAKNRPLLFHCTGGKDRAGTCAALFLLALGVPEETVIQDHQLSNVFIAPLWAKTFERLQSYGVDPDKLAPYFQAPLHCITSLLEHLRATYGSAADYLRAKAGVTEKTLSLLRRELLE